MAGDTLDGQLDYGIFALTDRANVRSACSTMSARNRYAMIRSSAILSRELLSLGVVERGAPVVGNVGSRGAADGNLLTAWRAATGVTTAGFDVALPVGVSVDTIRIFPTSQASLSQVQIDLLGDLGQLLDSRTETFVTPSGALLVSITPPVSDVHQVSLVFDGDPIHVGEIEVVGATTSDLGNAAPDVVFSGSAGIRLEVTRSSGEGLKSSFFARANNGVVMASGVTDDDGVFTLMAPALLQTTNRRLPPLHSGATPPRRSPRLSSCDYIARSEVPSPGSSFFIDVC